MAIKKFRNSFDLINYLCEEDVLGELIISFSQDAPYSSYNFNYPELEEYLDSVLFEMTEGISGVTSYDITFLDADDWDIQAMDNGDYSGINLTDQITQAINNLLKKELNLDTYALIKIEGSEFNADNFKVNKFEVYDWNNQKATLDFNPELRKKLLREIAGVLQMMDLQLETISHFYLDNSSGSDHFFFRASGSPYCNSHLDLDNEEEFILDTEKL